MTRKIKKQSAYRYPGCPEPPIVRLLRMLAAMTPGQPVAGDIIAEARAILERIEPPDIAAAWERVDTESEGPR